MKLNAHSSEANTPYTFEDRLSLRDCEFAASDIVMSVHRAPELRAIRSQNIEVSPNRLVFRAPMDGPTAITMRGYHIVTIERNADHLKWRVTPLVSPVVIACHVMMNMFICFGAWQVKVPLAFFVFALLFYNGIQFCSFYFGVILLRRKLKNCVLRLLSEPQLSG